MSGRDPWALLRWAEQVAVERELTATQAHVLIVLARHADRRTSSCHPSLATVAKIVRRGERETSRALGDLERLGIIERRGRGPGRTRATHLLVDSRPAASHADSRPASSQPDSRPASTKTRGEPLPRLAAHRVQNPQGNDQENIESPNPVGRARAREGANNNGDSLDPRSEESANNSNGDHDLAEQVRGILERGVWALTESWPEPTRAAIAAALAEHEPEPALAVYVAKEVRAIVQSQDRAPNVAGLYRSKLGAAVADQPRVRAEVRESLDSAGGAR